MKNKNYRREIRWPEEDGQLSREMRRGLDLIQEGRRPLAGIPLFRPRPWRRGR